MVKKSKKTIKKCSLFSSKQFDFTKFFFKRVGKFSFLKAKQKLHFNDS
jgi:hypothetical protein